MTPTVDSRGHLLLVHGAWHGSWCWQQLEPHLVADGWTVSTIDLPSVADDSGTAGMFDDARAVRERLDGLDGPVVVLAHSYGGVPASQAAAGAPNVSQLIFLAGYMLEVGESLASPVGWDLPEEGEGTVPPPPARESLYSDLSDEDAAQAEARLRPQSIRSLTERLTAAAWTPIPSAYVHCEKDQALPPLIDRMAQERAAAVYRLPSSHSPFLSMPRELAPLVGSIAGTTAGRP
ncbi:alpha/beta fold hydrolase [Pseudonocardia xinjiangensis]|uniref:alpha/beta fold hydrolase n=1 Tax=Pseudonocardia xinjiangensis TaxID=75289 RepID=UPI003D92C206